MATASWANLVETAKQGGASAVDPGDYPVQVVESTFTMTNKQPAKKMWKVKFRILEGQFAGKHVWNNFVLSPENPNALGFFFEHMGALGLTKEYFASLPEGEAGDHQVADALMNRYALITVTKKPGYKGGETNDVRAVQPLDNVPAPAQDGVPAPAPTQPQQAAPAPQPQAQPAAQPAAQPGPNF